MPRAERDIQAPVTKVAVFAQGLRDLRLQAGNASYRALAARTHFAPSTLSTAASGDRLPSLQVTLAYVKACRGDEEAWRRRWVEASRPINKQEAAARSEDNLEERERHAPATPAEEVLKIGNTLFKIAASVVIFEALIRAWKSVQRREISAEYPAKPSP